MAIVSETIPIALQPRADAALAWFNASSDAADDEFKVTGILDADDVLSSGSDQLRLIMCDGDRCEQRSFRVTGTNEAWQIEYAENVIEAVGDRPQAELDPPPGVRRAWLDKALSQHAFVISVFYRGFW